MKMSSSTRIVLFHFPAAHCFPIPFPNPFILMQCPDPSTAHFNFFPSGVFFLWLLLVSLTRGTLKHGLFPTFLFFLLSNPDCYQSSEKSQAVWWLVNETGMKKEVMLVSSFMLSTWGEKGNLFPLFWNISSKLIHKRKWSTHQVLIKPLHRKGFCYQFWTQFATHQFAVADIFCFKVS